MRIISRSRLKTYWEAHADAEQPLKAWIAEASVAQWEKMADIKARYVSASVVDAERVVFNIGGNKYRLIVKIWFPNKSVFIKFIGTHRAYDDIVAAEL